VTRAVGLDLSCSRSGVALPDNTTRSIVPRAGSSDPARRLNEIVWRLDAYLQVERATGVDLAVIEGYNLGPVVGRLAAVRLGEVGGAVRTRLFELGIPFIEIPPKQVKLWATGNGNASKDMMVEAAQADGAIVANHDEADAYWCHDIGRCRDGDWRPLSAPDPLREVRSKIRRSLKWPALAGGV
jgi:Holliday junction resolvasome RuvABC endonuclease subunit